MTFSPLTARTVATKKYSSRNGLKPTRLIIHYTAGGSDTGNETWLAKTSPSSSSTYVLRRDGSLTGIVPEEYRPWTSGGFAADGPAITVETVAPADGGVITAAQMQTLKKLAADLSKRYGWGKLTRNNIKGHREYANTNCPGAYIWPRMDEIVEGANKILNGSSGSTPVKVNKLVIDGHAGKATITKLQKVLGTTQDGVISSQSPLNRKYLVNLNSVNYGYNGSLAIKALQRKLGVAVDGHMGPQTIKALQRKLGVAADGYFGPTTVKALQRNLNSNKLW